MKVCTVDQHPRTIEQTFVADDAHEVLLLRVPQHVLLQVLLLLERRVAAFVVALERTILAVDVLDVNLQLSSGCEGRRTLVAVVIFDLEVTLQVLLDVLLLERSQAADVALEALLLQVDPLIVAPQVRGQEGLAALGAKFPKTKKSFVGDFAHKAAAGDGAYCFSRGLSASGLRGFRLMIVFTCGGAGIAELMSANGLHAPEISFQH